MARGEFVHNDIWEELEPLTQDAACLYLWSFTNSRCNMAGLYKVSERSMLESKVPARRLGKALQELEDLGFAFYRLPWLWVKGRIRRLHSTHKNIGKAVAKDVSQLEADHPLRVMLLERYAEKPWLKEFLGPLALESLKAKTLPTPSETPIGVPTACAVASPPENKGTGEGQEQTRALVHAVMAELRKCPRLEVPDHCEPAIESAITSHPDKDPLLAAKTAAVTASNPAWRQTWGPAALLYALRSQDEKAEQTVTKRRSVALKSVMGGQA